MGAFVVAFVVSCLIKNGGGWMNNVEETRPDISSSGCKLRARHASMHVLRPLPQVQGFAQQMPGVLKLRLQIARKTCIDARLAALATSARVRPADAWSAEE